MLNRNLLNCLFVLNEKISWSKEEFNQTVTDYEVKSYVLSNYMRQSSFPGNYLNYIPRISGETQYPRDKKVNFILDFLLRVKLSNKECYFNSFNKPYFANFNEEVYPTSGVLCCKERKIRKKLIREFAKITKESPVEVQIIKESPEIYSDWLQDNGFFKIAALL